MRGIHWGAPPGQRGLVKGRTVCVQGPLGTVRTQEPGEAGHIPDSMYRAGGAPERPRAGRGSKQEPCPHQWWHRWREDSSEVLDPAEALRPADVTLGPVLGEWMPVREARSQAPLTGPVITPVGLQGRAWEAQARLVAHLIHRKPPAASVLAICPRPTLACAVAGMEVELGQSPILRDLNQEIIRGH